MFAPKEYKYSASYNGSRAAAFDAARAALLALGFEMTTDSEGELHADGPGMHSSQQASLLGVSHIRFRAGSSRIRATATLGGVRKMIAFICVFPPGLALFLAAIFALLGQENWWVAFLAVSPWVILSPLLSRVMQRRTTHAVDALGRSMALAAAGAANRWGGTGCS